MRRIINTPRRGIGDKAQSHVALHAEDTRTSFGTALRAVVRGEVPMVAARSRNSMASFVELLDGLAADLETGDIGDIGDLVEAVLDRTGYRTELERSSDPQDATRLDNLNELVSVAREFSAEALRAGLDDAAGDGGGGVAGRRARAGEPAAFLERSLVTDGSDPRRRAGRGE